MRNSKTSLAVVLALALAAALEAPFGHSQSRIAGMPPDPDAEYLLFIVDNSGSMRRYEWDRVVVLVRETIARYPAVRGLQVLNDEGNNLLISYRDEWIPDTATNRAWILDELENFEEYSTSNPRSGLLAAFDRYSDPAKKIAIFVLGDDFSAGAQGIDPLLREVDQRNAVDETGMPRVRIHTIAFPVYWDQMGPTGMSSTGGDLASLMAALSQRSRGSFLALPARQTLEESPAPAPEAGQAAAAERLLIVIDASANMRAPDWQQAVASVEWLLDGVGAGGSFQVMLLNDETESVVAGTDGQWQSDPTGSLRDRTIVSLRNVTPAGAVDLTAVATAIGELDPTPDRVYLLAASDPALRRGSWPTVALEAPAGTTVDLLLFAAETNREAVPYYWSLALANGGSLVAPAGDWP